MTLKLHNNYRIFLKTHAKLGFWKRGSQKGGHGGGGGGRQVGKNSQIIPYIFFQSVPYPDRVYRIIYVQIDDKLKAIYLLTFGEIK